MSSFLRHTVTFIQGNTLDKLSGNITLVLGDMTTGGMTFGRLERLPYFAGENDTINLLKGEERLMKP